MVCLPDGTPIDRLLAGAAFDIAGVGTLFLENGGEGRDGRERKRSAFAVLGLTGIEADLTPLKIDVLPFPGEHFITSPAGPIHERDDGEDLLGQITPDGCQGAEHPIESLGWEMDGVGMCWVRTRRVVSIQLANDAQMNQWMNDAMGR